MIDRVIEWSAGNRFLVLVLVLAMTVWGAWSLEHTPVDAIPDLSENQVIVFADWMGRGPQEIEDQVTYPLSVSLQGLAGVKAVRSSSEFNFSMIHVIFEDEVDFYFARSRVLERLSRQRIGAAPGRDPLPRAGRDRARPDLLVHGGGRGAGPRASCARSRTGTCATSSRRRRRRRGRIRGGHAARVPGGRRSGAPARLRSDAGRGRLGGRAQQLVGRRPRRPQGQRRVPRPQRRLDPRRCATSRTRSSARARGHPCASGTSPPSSSARQIPPQHPREERRAKLSAAS